MAILTLKEAALAFGHVALLDNVELAIEAGERIGLIGRNGTGKSSLLRVLSGAGALDRGQLVRQSGLTVATVTQEPDFGESKTVYEAVAAGVPGAADLAEYHALIAHAYDAPADPASDPAAAAATQQGQLDRLAVLQDRLDSAGAWSLGHKIDSVISQLSLNPDAVLASLSGGTRKRAALAQALVNEPDLLLLDEPTNHLDIESITWLETLLVAYRGAIIVITHDRHFLDRVVTRIVELDRGVLRSYPGSFASYLARKRDELANERTASARFDKVLAQEEAWIRQGVEGRRKRNEGRVRRLEDLRVARGQRRERLGNVDMALDSGDRSGKRVAELIGVSLSFGQRTVLRDVDAIIQRGDKVGIIGPNGSGKTTLLRVLLGELVPDAGEVRLGTQRNVAYFDQLRAQLDEEATVAQTMSPGSDWIEIGDQRLHVMSYLTRFLFAPERARSPVKSLSGGERNRLLLAQLFARPANVLVLDEPTNDLDIDTLELLEELLADYPGTLLLVSHDRTFIDGVVTQVIAFEGDGRWREYAGGWSDWRATRDRIGADVAKVAGVPAGTLPTAGAAPGAAAAFAASAASVSSASSASTSPSTSASAPRAASGAASGRATGAASASASAASPANASAASRAAKLSFKEQRELDGLPARIAALETEQSALQSRLADPTTYQAGQPGRGTDAGAAGDALRMLNERNEQIDAELLTCLERWEQLEKRRDGR